MQTMESSRTDERIDDLGRSVSEMDREMRTEFRAVRSDAREEFAGVRSEIGDLRAEVNARFDAMQKWMVMLICTMIGGFVTLLGTMISMQF